MGSGDGESQPAGSDESTAAAPASDDGTGWLSSVGHRELALFGGVVVMLLAAVALGMGPTGGPAEANAEGTPTATPTPAATASGADSNATADRAPAITMQVRSIDSCGSRCREVTVALSNEGETAARDVRVETTMTTDGSLVWEGRSDIGRLPAGETATRTRTIEVGYVDAARIKANDGVIRIETTVRTASGTQTFTERRDVA